MGDDRLPGGDADGELVRRAAGGETAAFARLIRLHHEALTRVALVVTLDPELAARAVRDAWPRAWAGLGRHADRDRFARWAAGLVVDEAVDRARRDASRGPVPAPRPEAEPGSTEARLAALPVRDRARVALHVLAGRDASTMDARVQGLLDGLGGPVAVRTWADQPVRPVDADASATWARGEATFTRNARWSVVAATAVGLAVAGLPYLARLLQGR